MEKKDLWTKWLAAFGTALVWLPLLAPVLFSVIRLVQSGRFRFDYLMPAELFPVVLIGGGLLWWAARRAKFRERLIGRALGGAVVMLFLSQALAVATGLASGEIEAEGWPWALTLGGLILYDLLVVLMGVGGIVLVRDLFKASRVERISE